MSRVISDRLIHNFETAHRLPELGGKCVSLHGHSWNVEVTVSAPALRDGIVVEFSEFKYGLRSWVDTYLDHGVMLGTADQFVPLLDADPQQKLFVFGNLDAVGEEKLAIDLAWPTVEHVAMLLGRAATGVLATCAAAPGAWVSRVLVTETAVNAALVEWDRP